MRDKQLEEMTINIATAAIADGIPLPTDPDPNKSELATWINQHCIMRPGTEFLTWLLVSCKMVDILKWKPPEEEDEEE